MTPHPTADEIEALRTIDVLERYDVDTLGCALAARLLANDRAALAEEVLTLLGLARPHDPKTVVELVTVDARLLSVALFARLCLDGRRKEAQALRDVLPKTSGPAAQA